MTPYERPVVDRIQLEAARIPLPPRERWTPPARRPAPVLPVIGLAAAALVIAIIVVAPALDQIEQPTLGVGAAPTATAAAPASLACPPEQSTTPGCRLITARVVEVLGPELVRITPDTATIAADFENPALFEANARTRIEPSASSLAGARVTAGASVQLAFDANAPKTASGAYALTRFVVLIRAQAPACTNGAPHLENARFPPNGTHGEPTPEAAFRRAFPSASEYELVPFGQSTNAPVWIVAGTDTYLATVLPDRTWFVSPAKFVTCTSFEELRNRGVRFGNAPAGSPSPPPDPSNQLIPAGPLPTSAELTPEQVAAGMPAGAAIFAGTAPSCERTGAAFRCTLTSAPAPEIADFLGTLEPLTIAGRITGGCIGREHSGMTWDCYIGQDAVDRWIIGPDLLGQPAPYPGRG